MYSDLKVLVDHCRRASLQVHVLETVQVHAEEHLCAEAFFSFLLWDLTVPMVMG